MVNSQYHLATEFLTPFLIDEGILTGEPDHCKTELGKRVFDIYHRFEEEPEAVTIEGIANMIFMGGSQINPVSSSYHDHIFGVGIINRALAAAVANRHPELELPSPAISYAAGLVHDLSSIFCRSQLGGGQMHHLVDFFLAKRLGLQRIEHQTSMHSVHLEALGIIFSGKQFPYFEDYAGLRKVLQGNGPLSYLSILNQFREFMKGSENLPLILLAVSDFTADGRTSFDISEFGEAYSRRLEDVLRRYCQSYEQIPDQAPLISKALSSGGLDRINSYKQKVSELLEKT